MSKQRLGQTPWQTVGPFFHYGLPWKGGADLVGDLNMGARVELFPSEHDLLASPRKRGRIAGQTIEIAGTVFDGAGNAVPDAMIEIWQANAAGRYTNPVDTNKAPLDPNFLGVVSFGVAADGSYRLRTIRPGAYPEPSGTLRTPHVHFDVVNTDYRLVTQMYFPGEKLNGKDLLLSTLAARHRDPASSICKPATTSEPGVQAFTFDIVLLT